jgi:hypothetical protein
MGILTSKLSGFVFLWIEETFVLVIVFPFDCGSLLQNFYVVCVFLVIFFLLLLTQMLVDCSSISFFCFSFTLRCLLECPVS